MPWVFASYRLGRFPSPFLEWNDRYRDDVRRFWRGDAGAVGAFATRLAGSSDIFAERSRSVNFIAAHAGFAPAGLVAHEHKHNFANGEHNRDGHDHNISWNNGVEGATHDAQVLAARRRDVKALLATLFVSRGAIMLTAGDECGRSQQGNNNAYCQDNEIGWFDWAGRDREIESYVAELAAFRAKHGLGDPALLTDADVQWLTRDGRPFADADWHDPACDFLEMRLGPARIRFDRQARSVMLYDEEA